ncbi:MAG: TolC family protein [Bacteroidetes bacterium]|nr:TolC family protein [Bacteroidota bacterium]
MKPIYLIFCLLISITSLSMDAICQNATNSVSSPVSGGTMISLKECLKLSIANSPRIKISALEQTRLQYGYKETVGGGLPHVNFSGSWDDYLALPTSLIPGEFFGRPGEMIPVQFGTTYNISGALDVNQMLYNQTWLVALKMAKQLMQQNDLATEKTEIEVVYDVAQSYYMAQITLQQIKNMNSNIEKIEKAEKIAQSQWENGLIKKVDLDRIIVQKLNMVTDIERLNVLYQQELAMQKYFMGLTQEREISLDDSISPSSLPPGPEGDLNKHIDIRMIAQQKEIVNTSIRMDQSEYFPNLTFIGSVNYLNQSNTMYLTGKSTDWFNTSLVGLRLSVPVFSGLQRHYRVSQTRVELEKLNVSEDDTKKLIRINSGDAARKLLNSIDAEKRQRDNMGLAERVYSISQEQYQKGIIPLTDLLNAETALSDAQANHTYALVQMKISELNYLKANGRLLEIVE